MARYGVGNMPPCGECRVFDADGVEYSPVRECDDATGEIVKFVTDDKGVPIAAPDGQSAVYETVFGKPPLRFEPIGDGKAYQRSLERNQGSNHERP